MLDPDTGHSLDALADRRRWGEAAHPGTLSEQGAREGDRKAHGQHSKRTNFCWPNDGGKGCSGEEWLGPLSCPLMKLSLQPPGYFGTLEEAKFQMYHRERSCFRQQGQSVTHGAKSLLTTGCATKVRDPQGFQS